MDDLVAARIIESLRTGEVPLDLVGYFTVGRAGELSQAIQGLEAAEKGVSGLCFVNGPYGSGKTHFLGLLRAEALRRHFAVTHVVLSSRSCPLDRLQVVFGALMAQLNTPDCRDKPAFRSVLNAYIAMAERELITTGLASRPCRHPSCGSYLTCGYGCFAELLTKTLAADGPLTTGFHIVLTAYFNANRSNDQAGMRLCERWLLGQPLPANERRTISRLARITQRIESISNESALSSFGDAAGFLRAVGYRGLLLMLDEAEMMPSAGRAGMTQSFLNLVSLMAFCKQWRNILCVYATTPFFDNVFRMQLGSLNVDVGVKEWLTERYQANQIVLSIPERRDLVQLASSIYSIYEAAFGAHRLPGQSWLAEESQAMLNQMTARDNTRDFVTGFIGRMDRALQ